MPNWTREQTLAIYESGKNIIVSAGAGSGKTAVLSERVLKKIESGIDIDRLLILTFTKAASLEMKDRIRKKIKSNKDLSEQLNRLDNSYITTFDSYSLSIVKKYHYLLNVKKSINIIEDSILNIKIEKFLEEIFENKYQENDAKFLKLIRDFCIKDDSAIKTSIININHKLDMKYDKNDYLEHFLENRYNDDYINKNVDSYVSFLIGKIGIIKNLLNKLSIYVDGDYIALLEDNLQGLFSARTYEEIKNSSSIKLPNLKRGVEEGAKLVKKEIVDIIKEINDLTEILDTNSLIKTIYDTKDYVACIIDIIHKLDLKVNEYKSSNDLYDFSDISKMAIKVIKENEIVRDEIKNYFQEILVDEYQDTNDLQEEFISLIMNNNLYMVGDVKQSIYRFRNANPNIFRNKYNNYAKNNGGMKIDLLKNFRSRREVLDNINLMFDYIMDDDIGGANYRLEHEMVFGNNVYEEDGLTKQNNNLEIYSYPYFKELGYTRDEIESFIIANDIINKVNSHYQIYDRDKRALRDIEYGDFCILIDRSTSFDLYKKVFFYKHIPLNIFKDEYLTSGDILLVIKSIFKLLDIVINKKSKKELTYSFLSIGRSFLFDYDDDYLFKIIRDDKYDETLIFEKINVIKEDICSKSIKNILDEIISEFDIYNRLITIGNVHDNFIKLDYLHDLSDTLNEMEYTYIDFVDYIDTIINHNLDIKFSLNKDDNNSVKIMTIHKSKGLEYHVCYFPGLTPKFNDSEIKERFIYDNELGIITPYFNEGIGFTFYRELFKNNYKKEEISEKIRLFYVALTRAKEKMIFIVPDSENVECDSSDLVNGDKRLSYNSFFDILLSIKPMISKYITNIDLESINLTHDYSIISGNNVFKNIKESRDIIKTHECIKIDNHENIESHFSKNTIKLVTKEEKEKMNIGINIHYLLELIDFKNPKLDGVEPKFQVIINNFLNSSLLINISNAKIYKEYEFIYKDDGEIWHGIIDLMLEYDDHIDIIDYKLKNIDDKAYNVQLLGYKKYIESISGKEVHAYLYSIIDSKYLKIE